MVTSRANVDDTLVAFAAGFGGTALFFVEINSDAGVVTIC